MRSAECGVRNGGVVALGLCVLVIPCPVASEDQASGYTTQTIRGRVVYLAEAMEKQTGVRTVPEATQRILALQTDAGDLIPLLEDVRGRAFRRDQRLRDMQVELLVRRYRQSPAVQILRVFEIAKDGRYEIDYWCDVCAIAIYEDRECDCCQGPVELRRRKVD